MEKIYITNTTRKDFVQHLHLRRPNVVEIPKYALNHEVTFDSKEELDLFYKLCDAKIALGELIIGKTKESEAEKKNEVVESQETKQKQDLNEQNNNDFENSIKATLGSENAELKVSTKRGKSK